MHPKRCSNFENLKLYFSIFQIKQCYSFGMYKYSVVITKPSSKLMFFFNFTLQIEHLVQTCICIVINYNLCPKNSKGPSKQQAQHLQTFRYVYVIFPSQ